MLYDQSPTGIKARYDVLKTRRKNWESLWEELADYIMPHKADFITVNRTVGDRTRTFRLFDSTAIHANHLLASHMHGTLTSDAIQWFKIKFRNQKEVSEEGQEWLEQSSNYMLAAISESNFNTQISELYQDLCAFGTSCLFVENRPRSPGDVRLNFRTYHMESVVIEEGADGKVDTVFIQRRMTARQALQQWSDADLPKIKEKAEKNPDDMCLFLNCVTPNDKYDPEKPETDATERPFLSIWISMDDTVEVERSGYYELPYMAPRWAKVASAWDIYGFGPGCMSRPDIITLNEAKRYELSAWEKNIDPPMKASATGIVGDIHLERAGVTYMREPENLQPLQNYTDWQATQIKSQELRDSIRAIYLIDQLHIPERPNATATEIRIRYELMTRALGPTMGRLQAELLNPMIERVFNIMYRAGALGQMPENLRGADVDIEYEGPLAKSQRLSEADAIEQLLGLAIQSSQTDPSALDVFSDLPTALRRVGEVRGVPLDVMNSPEQIENKAKQREQMQQMAAQMGAQQQQADTAHTESQVQRNQADAKQTLRAVDGA